MKYLQNVALALSACTFHVANAAVIVPGATWKDTSGNIIQAHGGGFLKVCIISTISSNGITASSIIGRVRLLLVWRG